MTVTELYNKFCEYLPEKLRCEWDNDGIMVCPDANADVKKALVALDVTEEIVDYAIECGFDLIISHHPLIFRPLNTVTEENHISRKVVKLIANAISVFSFHTRADRAKGGVNDRLADIIGLKNTLPFGEDELGRIGSLSEEYELEKFADAVKLALGADMIKVSDGYNAVKRVAVVGGDGKDFVKAALEMGADTYVSGRLSYNVMVEAAEMGINLIEAGHFFTEQPVTEFFCELISKFDPNIYVEIADTNMIHSI